MTAAELIAELQKMPFDATVEVRQDCYCHGEYCYRETVPAEASYQSWDNTVYISEW